MPRLGLGEEGRVRRGGVVWCVCDVLVCWYVGVCAGGCGMGMGMGWALSDGRNEGFAEVVRAGWVGVSVWERE